MPPGISGNDSNEVPPACSIGHPPPRPLELDLVPLKRTAAAFDAVYVPLETGLLFVAVARGHRVDGLGMLLQQADYGFRKWFAATPVVTPERRALIEADLEATSPRR